MQVSLHAVVGADRFVPFLNLAMQVGVWTVDTTEADGVAVVKADHLVVHIKVRMQTVGDDPLHLRESVSDVVVHEVLQRIARPTVEMKFWGDATVIPVAAHHGDVLELAVVLKKNQPRFDQLLTEDSLMNRLGNFCRHDGVHVQSSINHVPTKEQHQLRDRSILPFFVGERHYRFEESHDALLGDCHIVGIQSVDLFRSDPAAQMPVRCYREYDGFGLVGAHPRNNGQVTDRSLQGFDRLDVGFQLLDVSQSFLQGRYDVDLLLLLLLELSLLSQMVWLFHLKTPCERTVSCSDDDTRGDTDVFLTERCLRLILRIEYRVAINHLIFTRYR